MAQKRRSNTASKAQRSKKVPARRASHAAAVESSWDSTKNDIVGVIIAVLAVALFIALVSPSTAIVTRTMSGALVSSFGTGAILFPIALFVFAITFFIDEEGPISGRVALGLLLIVLAVLAMLSINLPEAELAPEAVITPGVLEGAGGYVGGGLAWVLLKLVGRSIGNVLLAGMVIAGVVVCGFSISGAVSKLRARASEAGEAARERIEQAREERAAHAAEQRARVQAQQAAILSDSEGAKTSFIGERKTTVLKRRQARLLDDTPVIGELPFDDDIIEYGDTTAPVEADSEAVTVKVDRKKKPAKKTSSKKDAVPGFLAGNPAAISRPGDGDDSYQLPPLSILASNPTSALSASSDDELAAVARKLQATLEEFGLTSRVTGWTAGPSVTTFKISPGEGERVSKITNLEDDIALSLAAKSVRIFAPIPGTSQVGIEIPNDARNSVYLADVLPYAQDGPLEAAFGRDSEGKPIVVDLATLPHLLVAGTTGSGKSVMLNSIVMSILMRATPEQVRLIMVDPKRVEFTGYAGLPHLYVPVVTEPRQAASALQWGVSEMERRLKVFEHYKVRDIKSYNKVITGEKFEDAENKPVHMPYFVIVIDELADLMMVAGKDVESSIVRIAQLGRAAGIHLIVATQRPSADVVTGLIKANIDNRVALSVDNGMNSRIILDQTGAERLLGNGDMLIKLRGRRPKRAQGCFVSDEEIDKTVEFIRTQAAADYHEDILSLVAPGQPGAAGDPADRDEDPLIWEAAKIVVESQLGSTSGLQRQLAVGYARAGRIMDMLEAKGVVGPPNGSKPRDVLLDADGLEELRQAEAQFREVE